MMRCRQYVSRGSLATSEGWCVPRIFCNKRSYASPSQFVDFRRGMKVRFADGSRPLPAIFSKTPRRDGGGSSTPVRNLGPLAYPATPVRRWWWSGSPATAPRPAATVRQDNIACMQDALANLPEEQREVIRLHYLQDQSILQVAEGMNRTPDAVRGLCYRARKNLRTLMGQSSQYFSG